MSSGLTIKQEAFCLAYMETGNASEAYRRAYNAGKMKPETVNRNAHALLDDNKIAARVAELRSAVAEKAVISEARVLEEVARIGLADPRKLFNADGTPKDITQLDDDTAAALVGIEVQEVYEGYGEDRKFVGYTKKYKLADKNSALEKLMKHLGMFEKDNKQRSGMFENVPSDKIRLIEEKLRALSGRPGLAGTATAGSPSRFTH